MPKPTRKGGLGIDPAVAEWQRGAVANRAAETTKQKRDRERVRTKIDLPRYVKDRLQTLAAEYETSESQLAAWLLDYAMAALNDDADLEGALNMSRRTARALRFKYDLQLPDRDEEE